VGTKNDSPRLIPQQEKKEPPVNSIQWVSPPNRVKKKHFGGDGPERLSICVQEELGSQPDASMTNIYILGI
jgi:hypothetical protein